jgi:hypothetical protein
MTRLPTSASRRWAGIGLALAVVHLIGLSAIALFDDRRLADLVDTLPWLALVALPAVLGCVGLRRPNVLPWAAGISLPLTLLSLAGATVPLLLPATFYLLGFLASARAAEQPR